jgi:hypothetical protein
MKRTDYLLRKIQVNGLVMVCACSNVEDTPMMDEKKMVSSEGNMMG